MDRMRIGGGSSLVGTLKVSGAKNASLPLLTAGLLTADKLVLENVPKLADIETMQILLEQHGVSFAVADSDPSSGYFGQTITLSTPEITSAIAPYDIVRKMRAGILVLGPLLARCGEAKVSLPGGCSIGTRPVDFHVDALRRMGAEIVLDNGYIDAKAPQGLKGAEVVFPEVSVTGTENVLMAASLAKGTTVIINAAREPEVTDLAECLVKMGAEIEGIGSGRLVVHGKESLHGATHAVVADRIEAGTFIMMAAATQGCVTIEGANADHLTAVIKLLRDAGVSIEETDEGIVVDQRGKGLTCVDVKTEPFPGFPTDLQAQIMALMCLAEGASNITETIFENRFMHVPELKRMGADISVHGQTAMVRGGGKLIGAPVMATDLRASVSLVIAAMAAEGDTILSRIYHLDRGYDRLEEKLTACGVVIERLKKDA